jgi:hypothetical protein
MAVCRLAAENIALSGFAKYVGVPLGVAGIVAGSAAAAAGGVVAVGAGVKGAEDVVDKATNALP